MSQPYPFNIQKFPDDDDILLTEADLRRKRIVFCRKEILEQMKCTQWAKDEYLAAGLDTDNREHWMRYHLQKCYTPYQDGFGCVLAVRDREIQKMKQQAGPKGWEWVKEEFLHRVAPKVGEHKARILWEYRTKSLAIHEKSRRREGHLFGEGKPPAATIAPPSSTAKALGVTADAPAINPEFLDLARMAAAARKLELEKERKQALVKQQEEEAKRSQKKKWFWGPW